MLSVNMQLIIALLLQVLCYDGIFSRRRSSIIDEYFPQYQSRAHRVRHVNPEKLQLLYMNTQAEESAYCLGRPQSADWNSCPVDKCRTNADCQSWNDRYCACDMELCGGVCLERNFKCHPLPHLYNGEIRVVPMNSIQARAEHTCKLGYKLNGTQVRICQANQKWSHEPPICEIQNECGDPPARKNARHNGEGGPYQSGSTVDYECEPGFVNPIGFSNRFTALCVGKALWRVPQFECTDRSCGHPGTLENGRRFGGLFVYTKKVSYFCHDGYILTCSVPNTRCEVRECQANGLWSGSRPICEPIRCSRLAPPEHGSVSSSWLSVNSIFKFQCDVGYRLIGSHSRRCRENGTWDGIQPRCQIQECGEPPRVPYSEVSFISTKFNSKAIYTCSRGTTFHGKSKNGELTCDSNGTWTPDPPECLLHCIVPRIDYGMAYVWGTNNTLAVGTVASDTTINVTCNDGYEKSVKEFPICKNGTWSILPRCMPARCISRPQVIHNGLARFYSNEHGSKARYFCYVGYEIVFGSADAICEFGKWHGTKPTCAKKICVFIETEAPLEKWLIGSGSTMKNPWIQRQTRPVHGDVVYFVCENNQIVVGYSHAICLDGRWSPSGVPRCEPRRYQSIPQQWLYYRRGRQ